MDYEDGAEAPEQKAEVLAPSRDGLDKPGVQRVSHTHEAFINWMIANPGRALGDMALYFGYSQAWCSTVIHSDAFQAKLRERQEVVFAGTADKLRAVTDMALDKLMDVLPVVQDPVFILDATDKLLARQGYGAKSAVVINTGAQTNTTNTQINVTASALASAREKMLDASKAPVNSIALQTAPKEGGDPKGAGTPLEEVPIARTTIPPTCETITLPTAATATADVLAPTRPKSLQDLL